jgi:plastocyanin
MSKSLFTSLLAASALAANCTVLVGSGGRRFEPTTCTANPGDFINFEFRSGGHNVVQGPSASSCSFLAGGYEFPANANDGATTPSGSRASYRVPATGPLYFFCDPHCFGGMRFQVQVVPAVTTNVPVTTTVAPVTTTVAPVTTTVAPVTTTVAPVTTTVAPVTTTVAPVTTTVAPVTTTVVAIPTPTPTKFIQVARSFSYRGFNTRREIYYGEKVVISFPASSSRNSFVEAAGPGTCTPKVGGFRLDSTVGVATNVELSLKGLETGGTLYFINANTCSSFSGRGSVVVTPPTRHTVIVGGDANGENLGNYFTPGITKVKLGDIVNFKFPIKKHNVIQSDATNACVPLPNGFQYYPTNTTLSFDYIVGPSYINKKHYFYCGPHCDSTQTPSDINIDNMVGILDLA